MVNGGLILLSLHNLLRWAVVILGVLAVGRALSGWLGNRAFTTGDARLGMLFTVFFDVQVLLGVLLYLVRGWGGVALSDIGAAMRDAALRFFAVEHIGLMLVALVFTHIGRSLSKKAPEGIQKHRRAAIWFGAALLLTLAAIPWPFLSNGRPWLRLLGLQF